MERYSLEIENWGDWSLERDFSSIDRAQRHGLERFPQNEWRILNRASGDIVHHHNPTSALEEVARQETARFASTERWRQTFAERIAGEVAARQQRERLADVANRQRLRQREQEQQRRERLRGFSFVGEEPPILRDFQAERMFVEGLRWGRGQKMDTVADTINWKKEGF